MTRPTNGAIPLPIFWYPACNEHHLMRAACPDLAETIQRKNVVLSVEPLGLRRRCQQEFSSLALGKLQALSLPWLLSCRPSLEELL